MLDPNKIAGELRSFTEECRTSNIFSTLSFDKVGEDDLRAFFEDPELIEVRDTYLKAFCTFGSFYHISSALKDLKISMIDPDATWKTYLEMDRFLDKFYGQLGPVGFILEAKVPDSHPNRLQIVSRIREVLTLTEHDLVVDMWDRKDARKVLRVFFSPECFVELRHLINENVNTRMWDVKEPLVPLVQWFQTRHVILCNMKIGVISCEHTRNVREIRYM